MKRVKRFLVITEGMSWKKRFYILSYAYLPVWLFDIIWKGYEE
jgi:hypothetical protein